MTQFASLADVLHANRLTTNGIIGNGEHHERNIALVLLEHLFQLLQADITLEGNFQLGVVSLGNGNIDGECLAALNVTLRGVEMGVTGDDLAGLHEVAEQHVLSGTTLVSRDNKLETSQFGNSVFHVVEGAGTAVALIAHHHRAPLTVAHGTRTRVGEQVNIDVVALQHENVVVGFKEPLFAFFSCGFLNGFNHLDFPRFCKW